MKGKKLSAKEKRELLTSSKVERAKTFKELLAHLRAGFSLDCFPALSDVSIRTYLKTYPEEFVEEEFVQALRDGKLMWEGIGHRQAQGTCLGNSRSWYYNMANRYGWREKVDLQAEHSGTVNVNVVSYASNKRSTDTPEH